MIHTRTLVLTSFLSILSFSYAWSQDTLPYHHIEAYPAELNAQGVLQRLVDGLGYRYYWATEGLTEAGLTYKAEELSRSNLDILDHVYDLSQAILSFSEGEAMVRTIKDSEMAWIQVREKTLRNLKSASDHFAQLSSGELARMKVVFQRGDRRAEFELWHVINGQISDAIYHVGQIVYNRRAAGNPIDPSVNVFMGANRFK